MLQSYVTRLIVYGAALLIAALALAVGAGFLGIALYLALGEVLTPPLAALATGLAAVVLAVIVVVLGGLAGRMIAASKRRQWRRRPAEGPAGAGGLASELGMLAGAELGTLFRSHRGASFAAILAAGFAVGASPALRRLLRDLLEL